jgi:5-methylcytosine-specific restriction enzyme A
MGIDRAPSSFYKSPRWKFARTAAKQRDNWKCVECGARGRLEVHHIKRVKHHPELAYDLENLKTLCVSCHAKVTAIETGIAPVDPKRHAWRVLIAAMVAKANSRKRVTYVD